MVVCGGSCRCVGRGGPWWVGSGRPLGAVFVRPGGVREKGLSPRRWEVGWGGLPYRLGWVVFGRSRWVFGGSGVGVGLLGGGE